MSISLLDRVSTSYGWIDDEVCWLCACFRVEVEFEWMALRIGLSLNSVLAGPA